jgi:hypothetical protein
VLRACDLIGRLRRDQCGCVRGRAARNPQGSAAAAELFFYEMKGRGRAVPCQDARAMGREVEETRREESLGAVWAPASQIVFGTGRRGHDAGARLG